MARIDRSEITPEHLYLSRRRFIKGLTATAGAAALAACAPASGQPTEPTGETAAPVTAKPNTGTTLPAQQDSASTQVATVPAFPTLSADVDELGGTLPI